MIRISDDKKQVIPSKRLWAMANWSRFVRPGAVRVGTSGGPSGAKVSAFKNVDGTVSVQVIQGGTGSGTVTSSPAGISCGSTCSSSFTQGTAVTLTASPNVGSTFTGWGGSGCSGTGNR